MFAFESGEELEAALRPDGGLDGGLVAAYTDIAVSHTKTGVSLTLYASM